MTFIIDQAERSAALDPTRSFIVQAPAGSGKTELLIQRYLKLLGGVEYPEQILCMTFTRKAAGEMRDRILGALEDADKHPAPEEPHRRETWQLAAQALERDRRQGWHLLQYPSRLKVQTIDSFCAWLVRHMPLTSRMGGMMQPEEYARGAYLEATRRLLAMAEENSATGEQVRRVLRHLDNDKIEFQNRIRQLLEKRDQWLIPFFQHKQPDQDTRWALEAYLGEIVRSVLLEADLAIPEDIKRRLPPLAAYSAQNLNEENPDPPHPLLNMKTFPEPTAENLEQWRALTRLLLTGNGQLRKKVDVNLGFPPGKGEAAERKQTFKKILDSLAQIPYLKEILNEVYDLPETHYTDAEWDILQATLELLGQLDRTLRQVFRQQETTDFTEISLSAIRSLGEYDSDGNLLPTDLALYLDYKLTHILVDEFQDTSFKQHELLRRLTAGWTPGDGRTLFIVGDPMQSIFRFRDAQVDLFLHTQLKGVGDIPLERLTLRTNFRSRQNLLDWVNACFERVFPTHQNRELGEIPFTPSEAFHPPEKRPGVVLYPNARKDEKAEAEQVADLVENLQRNHREAKVAILVRAKRHLAEIVQAFRARNMTYKAEDIDPLTRRWEILDLLALMRALRAPLDRISWLAVLRAPWCGLTLADLHALCQGQADRPVWHLLTDRQTFGRLSPDGQRRAGRLCAVMQPALDALPRTHFRDLLEGLWIALGGPGCIPASSMQDVEVFFDEVGHVVESGALHRLDRFEEELDRLFASPNPAESNLHILTMHKAKGLEFDFVILPGLGRPPRYGENRLMYWLPHGDSVLLAPIAETGDDPSRLYQFIKELDKRKEAYEAKRLLYVSATRAKRQLHLFGHVQKTQDGAKPEPGSALHHLWPYLEEVWLEKLQPEADQPPEKTIASYPATLRRLKEPGKTPPPAPALPTGKTVLLEEPEQALYEWAGYRARCLGTVLHRALQHLAETGWDAKTPLDAASWENRLRTALMGMGLAGRDFEQAVAQGLAALKNLAEDEQGRWLLAPHEEAQNEYALTWVQEGRVEQRILDRTFVDRGERWVVDYKTGVHEGADLDRFFEQEKERYRPQLETYARLLQLKGETRPIRKAIYNPVYKKLLEV